MSERVRGVVKWYREDKGYGFLTPEDNSGDCFVHVSSVEGNLQDALPVEFDIIQTPKGKKAINVRAL